MQLISEALGLATSFVHGGAVQLNSTSTPQSGDGSRGPVNVRGAFVWTLVWIVPAVVYVAYPTLLGPYEYNTYLTFRTVALLLIVILALAGIVRAWKIISGGDQHSPWYTDAFLVALVLFWAVAPPIWFFVEYYLFDSGLVKLPVGAEIKSFLARTKIYADMASKIWAGVGASLGAALAVARK